MPGPAAGRRERVSALRALLACLALLVFHDTRAEAQTLTSDLLRPVRDGFMAPQDLPLRRTPQSSPDDRSSSSDNRLRNPDAPAPSRIGNIPTYGLPAASGASIS